MEPAEDTRSVEHLIRAVQTTLAERYGSAVQLGEAVVLRDSDRSRVVRCSVLDGPADLPASLILKHVLGDTKQPYDPDNVTPFGYAWRFFNDWAGVEFLSGVSREPLVCPRFYGGDRAKGFIILEDFGEGESLADLLLGEDPVRAEQGLLTFAATLGRMHAATIGREAEYRRLRDALAAPAMDAPAQGGPTYPRFREGCDAIGFPLSPGFETELSVVTASMRDPGPFLAYTHGDPCPDNDRILDGQLRLFDFEHGAFRHALRDGVYGRVPFPTCWCVNRLPEEIPPRMEAAYRAELVKGCPEAADDTLFSRAVVEACAHWAFETTGWLLPDALKEDHDWGVSTIRQRLPLRLEIFATLTAERGYLEALGATARELAAKLRAVWSPAMELMPLYPAFRASHPTATTQP